MRIFDCTEKTVGATPMVRLSRLEDRYSLACSLIVKLEFMNPSGSVKDRAALYMINSAERSGLLRKNSIMIEATSGNLGISLAMLCAARGYRLMIVMPDGVSKERADLIRAYGAQVITVKGGMKEALEKVQELKEEIADAFIPNQFGNSANVEAHRLTTGPEIFRDTEGQVDILVAGVGSGGTISGAGGFLKCEKPAVKAVAVEPFESAVLSGKEAGKHRIQGLGAGFVPKILDREVIDEIITVKYCEAVRAARELAECEGILSGISSGAALSAAIRVADRKENYGKTIVVILPDGGERYLSTDLYSEAENKQA